MTSNYSFRVILHLTCQNDTSTFKNKNVSEQGVDLLRILSSSSSFFYVFYIYNMRSCGRERVEKILNLKNSHPVSRCGWCSDFYVRVSQIIH